MSEPARTGCLMFSELSEYFEISLAEIPTGEPLPFDIYIHFPDESRILPVHRAGETLTESRLHQFQLKGVSFFRVALSQADAFRSAQLKRKLSSNAIALSILQGCLAPQNSLEADTRT